VAEEAGLIRAAGGVLWRLRDDGGGHETVEVAVIHRPRYDDWSLPKGKLARGESETQAAVREVLEETGFKARVGRPLGEARYLKRVGGVTKPKVVTYWSMRSEGGSFTPTPEVDELRWLDLDSAHQLLTRGSDRDLLDRFVRVETLPPLCID
jgi:8-oxo-dGTP pyrophosphatase MutT (NUDIX family)